MAAPWTDEQHLEALHLRDNEGLSYAEIGRKIKRSRGSLAGALHRIDVAIQAECPPDKHDGTMKPEWWKR